MKNTLLNRLPSWMLILALLIGTLVSLTNISAGNAQTNDPTQAGQSKQATDYLTWAYPEGIEAYKDAPFAPGEILVGYHRDQIAAAGLQSQLGLQVIDSIDLRGLDGSTSDAGVAGYVMSVPTGSEWASIERLLEDPSVAFATPNWTVRAAGTSVLENESKASIEIPFDIDDTFYADRQWYAQRINASRAWQLAYPLHSSGNRPIRVAIIDSGVDSDHADLKPHLLSGNDCTNQGETCLDWDGKPNDYYGHGTHVAGVIAATLNNASGISGMSPWVEIDPYKVLDENGRGTVTNLSKAIMAAADSGADIINLSLETEYDIGLIGDAIDYAATKNVLMVAAAGNRGNCAVMYPAAYDAVMAVASTDYNDERSSFSAVGTEVEIAAPGGGIFSTWSEDAIDSEGDSKCDSGFQEEDGSVYCENTGTSMAASVVSGVAALAWGLDPSMPSEAVRALLTRTAKPLPEGADYVGSGRVDALAAVREFVPKALEPSVAEVRHAVTSESKPFTSTIEISNPSSEAITWTAELALDRPWVQIAGMTGADTVPTPAQTVQYGNPGYVSLIFSPDQATVGLHVNSLVLRGEDTIEVIPIALGVDTDLVRTYYFPTIHQSEIAPTGVLYESVPSEDKTGPEVSLNATDFQWEIPADESDRIRFVMTDGNHREASLPFSFPFADSTYDAVRLHSDGALTLPATDPTPLPSANRCLPESLWPSNGIYGWWADLDPGQSGATVSGFPVNSDRYVFEFADVPSADGVEPGYVVSFQMVLDSDGDIKMNYLDVPTQFDRPPQVTVGMESTEGRFHNQIFCSDETTTLRVAPGVKQSLNFRREDIY